MAVGQRLHAGAGRAHRAAGRTRARCQSRQDHARPSAKGAAASESVKVLDVVADRFRIGTAEPARVMEAIEPASSAAAAS